MSQPESESRPQRPSFSAVFAIQLGIVVLAVVLGWVFGLDLLGRIEFSVAALNWSVLGTLPLLLGGWWLSGSSWEWMRELKRLVQEMVALLFRDAPPGTVFLVAVLAGLGEELLFRGVVQGGLDGLIGPWGALLAASLLFGAMHALTRAYFVVATIMGLYLGLIYLWTGNMLIPILIHFLYDWVILRYYLAADRAI